MSKKELCLERGWVLWSASGTYHQNIVLNLIDFFEKK